MDEQPRSGSVRVNDGPWLPCRFTLNGALPLVDWRIDAASREGMMPGAVSVELAICEGVSVFGEAIITDVYPLTDWKGPGLGSFATRPLDPGFSVHAVATGPLRGAR